MRLLVDPALTLIERENTPRAYSAFSCLDAEPEW